MEDKIGGDGKKIKPNSGLEGVIAVKSIPMFPPLSVRFLLIFKLPLTFNQKNSSRLASGYP